MATEVSHTGPSLRPDPQPPMVGGKHSFDTMTDKITSVIFAVTPKGWIFGFAISFLVLQVLLMSITYLLYEGIGIWGVNIPVGWGFDIVNFVWWIGIGHAGTLISAILLLFNQTWRTSINRFAEAMTASWMADRNRPRAGVSMLARSSSTGSPAASWPSPSSSPPPADRAGQEVNDRQVDVAHVVGGIVVPSGSAGPSRPGCAGSCRRQPSEKPRSVPLCRRSSGAPGSG